MKNVKSNVQILMSTYNGEKYLSKQLETLLNQKNVNLDILIRDDGSKDSTKEIINDYMKKYSNITYIVGKNLGYAKSFWDLIKNADLNYDYYAFCDQDDIWEENKLDAAISLLKNEDNSIPLLYTSRVVSVDNNMNILNENTFEENRVLNVYESFQKSIVPGCVFVFNKAALVLLKKYDGFLESHDWATYIIVSSFGKVIYDNNSYIKYRIHENNTIGKNTKLQSLIKKIKRFFRKSKKTRSKFAHDFYNTYSNDIPSELCKNIKYLAFYDKNLKYKLLLLCSKKFKGLMFKIYVLLNRV